MLSGVSPAAAVIGIPYAIKKFVDWQFAQQEMLFEDPSMREALLYLDLSARQGTR